MPFPVEYGLKNHNNPNLRAENVFDALYSNIPGMPAGPENNLTIFSYRNQKFRTHACL